MNHATSTRLEYRSKHAGTSRPYLLIAGALGAMLLSVALFVVSVSRPAEDRESFPVFIGMTTVPMMFGVFMLWQALVIMRTPRVIRLSRQKLAIDWTRGTQEIAWEDIARVETDKKNTGFQEIDALVLFDAAGKKLVVLTWEIDGFEKLRSQICTAIRKTSGNTASDARLRKSKGKAIIFAAGAALCAAGSIFTFIDASHSREREQLLSENTVQIDARITRHYRRSLGRRIEYSFADEAGTTHTNDVLVAERVWNRYEGAETLPIRYAPSRRDVNEPLDGEIESSDLSPGMTYFASVALVLMTGLFLLVAVLQWRGMDIDVSNNRIRLIRFGENDPDQVGT